MFVQKLDQVTAQLCRELPSYKSDQLCRELPSYNVLYLFHATRIWCDLLDDITPAEKKYILEEYKQLSEVKKLTSYLYEDLKEEEGKNFLEKTTIALTKSRLSHLVAGIFNRMNIKSGNMKIIVLIAFGITAVGYLLYKINQKKQEQTFRREEPTRPYNPNLPSPTVQTSTVQASTNQFLVLVVSASQADFLESLKLKGRINVNDGKELYKMTKHLCLWLGSETDFNQKKVNINMRHKVLKEEEESEFDIYLIYIELSQAYEGFKKDVSQVDRHNAFRKFDNLANFEISHRLQMEAYENFEVYNR